MTSRVLNFCTSEMCNFKFLLFCKSLKHSVECPMLYLRYFHPFDLSIGSDPQMNPKAYIVCEKQIINEDQVSCSKAVNIWFMAHFVFKYAYSHSASPILEFLQRQVLFPPLPPILECPFQICHLKKKRKKKFNSFPCNKML